MEGNVQVLKRRRPSREKSRAGGHRTVVRLDRLVRIVRERDDLLDTRFGYECHWYRCQSCGRVDTRRAFTAYQCGSADAPSVDLETLPRTLTVEEMYTRSRV